MAAVTGPDFVALQVRDLARFRDSCIRHSGCGQSAGRCRADTKPIAFAVREPLVDLHASSRLGWGVALWLAADDPPRNP